MPTYDYECNGCGHAFELFQNMSDALKKKCPKCGTRKLQRLIGSGAGVIFKGSGFYQTDYKNNNKQYTSDAKGDKNKEKLDKPADKKSDAKAGKSTKSKTEK